MKLALYGAGGMGREIMVAARETGNWDELVFLVDAEYLPENRMIKGCRVYSLEEAERKFSRDEIEVLICVGEPDMRKKLYDRIISSGFRMGRFIDPSVKLHDCTKLGEGVILLRGCILASDVTIGNNTALSFGVIVGHDNCVGAHCYLAPGVMTGGFVKWHDLSFGGLGCTIRQGVEIGEHALVGQGACVTKSVSSFATVVGNPAKQLGQVGVRKVFG